jgi:hypothetical protein
MAGLIRCDYAEGKPQSYRGITLETAAAGAPSSEKRFYTNETSFLQDLEDAIDFARQSRGLTMVMSSVTEYASDANSCSHMTTPDPLRSTCDCPAVVPTEELRELLSDLNH